MATTIASVVVDTADPGALAHWYADVLGWHVTGEHRSPADAHASASAAPPVALPAIRAGVSPPAGTPGLPLTFVRVDEPRRGKNRMHLDLASASLDHQAEVVERLLAAGARHADVGQGDVPWVVLTDPHENELCVLEPREVYRDTGAVAAVVVDTDDPVALAPFWAAATGWPVTVGEGGIVGLQAPDGTGPWLELLRVPTPRLGKNRLHLDLTPTGSTREAEVERLVRLGATPVEIGQSQAAPGVVTWTVLADPEGNELCVLAPSPAS